LYWHIAQYDVHSEHFREKGLKLPEGLFELETSFSISLNIFISPVGTMDTPLKAVCVSAFDLLLLETAAAAATPMLGRRKSETK
jgi:hypothetical protein